MKLKIYVLPTINNHIVMHPAFLKPQNKLELGSFFIGFVMRKWRFQISDYFGQYWHQQSSLFYRWGNRLTTRNALDEQFFKMVPNVSTHIEFVIPPSISKIKVEEQLREWLLDSSKFGTKLFGYSMLLPLNFYLAKYLGLLPANVVFAYHVYRLNGAFRAHYGSKRLQTLIDTNRVTFTASQEWEDSILKNSDLASAELSKENIGYVYKKGDDVHDYAILELQKEYKLPELIQTVRRARLVYHVFQH